MDYGWDFRFLAPYARAFVRGTGVTLELSVYSFLLGTAAGLPLGIGLRFAPARHVWIFLNDCVRAVPPLVLLFFVYYLPLQGVWGDTGISPFAAGVIALALAQAAYTADLVRGAIDAVPKRTVLGARALGLPESSVWRYVILPDIARQTLPAQVAFLIGIVRLSSLASVIGVQDSVFVARSSITQSFRSFEPWLIVALIYMAIVVPMTIGARSLENLKWLKRR